MGYADPRDSGGVTSNLPLRMTRGFDLFRAILVWLVDAYGTPVTTSRRIRIICSQAARMWSLGDLGRSIMNIARDLEKQMASPGHGLRTPYIRQMRIRGRQSQWTVDGTGRSHPKPNTTPALIPMRKCYEKKETFNLCVYGDCPHYGAGES
jgi:hypothetical protein